MNIAALRPLLLVLSLLNASALADVPTTEQRPVKDVLHGNTLIDNYRWLEGDAEGKLTDEVVAWTDSQNAHTRSVLDALPGRARLEDRLRELMEVPRISAPRMYGKRYFYSRREGDQPQPLHYMRKGLDGEEKLLLDPREVDPSGLTTISWTHPSNDGKLMAFGMYRSGDENSVLYVMNVDSGEWLAEEIPGKVRLSRWLPDGSGFFYSRLEDIEDPYSGMLKLHKLGTHHRQDKVLFSQRKLDFFYGDSDKTEEELKALASTWGPGSMVSKDGRWIAVYYWTGTDSLDLWMGSLEEWRKTGELKLKLMVMGQKGRLGGWEFIDDTLYLQHSFGAPNYKVSVINAKQPGMQNWKDLVSEHDEKVIAATHFTESRIAVDYLFKAQTRIELFDYKGKSKGELELPGIGSAGLSTALDRDEAFLVFTSFNMPRSIYHLNLREKGLDLWARPDVPVDPDSITVKQVWYSSKDGTRVSMFLVHHKDVELNGDNPTILYGYGGFNVSETPYFSATLFPWFEGGGVFALPNLRGGGEYGRAWHEAGMLENKQNVFDDFIAAAQWLIDNGYTRPQRLGIAGGSNGGLLTGAVVVQRPELFGAVISAVPLLDMLRYQNFLMARYWVPEYGSAENADQFDYLRAYSPYHNVAEDVRYPAVLLTAGENDTRVHPLHARKMAALMQARTASDPEQAPILLWVDRDAGHGQGKPLDLRIRDVADQRIFMMWQLGMLNR